MMIFHLASRLLQWLGEDHFSIAPLHYCIFVHIHALRGQFAVQALVQTHPIYDYSFGKRKGIEQFRF